MDLYFTEDDIVSVDLKLSKSGRFQRIRGVTIKESAILDKGYEIPDPDPLPEPEPEQEPEVYYDPADFDRVVENLDLTETLRLEGPEWDNTLVRDCYIHDHNGDGIFLKNVSNVVVYNCTVRNVGENGIKCSSTGSTRDVIIDGNTVSETGSSAIHAPQRAAEGIDHPGLAVINNDVRNTGQGNDSSHHIYVQSQDFLIEGNHCYGTRGGNGITVRSSGKVIGNSVSGTSVSGKPAIRYFSDHQTGPSNTLVIQDNVCEGSINLFAPVERYDGMQPPEHVVKNFIIRDNVVDEPVEIDPAYRSSPYTVEG